MRMFRSGCRACFASQGKKLVGFERNLAGRQPGGNHMHLNCVGIDGAAAGATKAAFTVAAKRCARQCLQLHCSEL